MITANQAKEAIKTIAEYCSQLPDGICGGECALNTLCYAAWRDISPDNWPEYLEE